jgi:hypothetical protein
MKFELCRASAEEVRESLPGDQLIPSPRKTITHAVTIAVPPEGVSPWLVQLGSGRAGWYSYDRVDNGGMPNAKRIIPKLQLVAVSDLIPALLGTKDAFFVREVQPGACAHSGRSRERRSGGCKSETKNERALACQLGALTPAA